MSFGMVVLGAVGLALGFLVMHVVTRMASDWNAATRRRHDRRVASS